MTVIRSEYTTPQEVLEPYLGALTLMVAFTAAMPPGVLWHCARCHERTPTTTLLSRPSHCDQLMEVEEWASLIEFMVAA